MLLDESPMLASWVFSCRLPQFAVDVCGGDIAQLLSL
jgi:hypothetical protein